MPEKVSRREEHVGGTVCDHRRYEGPRKLNK